MRIPALSFVGAAFLNAFTAAPAAGQAATTSTPPGQEQALRVFLDCRHFLYCDSDFFRTEIPFVNHVRDQRDAQLHVLVTTQGTGGGGVEFTLTVIGDKHLAGKSDTLRYVSRQTATPDEVRRGLARVLKMGLIRHVAGSSLAERIQISFDAPEDQKAAGIAGDGAADDPWNYWVFRSSFRGFFRGEQSVTYRSLNGSLTASRTTADWKVSLGVDGGFSTQTFDTGERIVESEQENYGLSGLLVKSVGGHWSTGIRASVTSSTFLNQALAVRMAPAVEYNIFPYSESTRRQLRLLYSAGPAHFEYAEETIFFKSREQLMLHNLTLALDVRQPWGSANTSLVGSQYLHDLSKYSVNLYGNLSLRLFKGFSFNLGGSAAMLRDQLHLARRGASEEEILLQRRQLATSYRYFTSIGVSYSFGSIYNNIVNPRFGGSSDVFFFF